MYNFESNDIHKLLEMLEQGELNKGDFRLALLKLLAAPPAPAASSTNPPVRPRGVPTVNTEYSIAQTLTSFQFAVGIAFILIGIFLAIGGSSRGGMYEDLGLFAGILSALGGVSIMGMSQLTKALIDTADHTRETYFVLHQRLP